MAIILITIIYKYSGTNAERIAMATTGIEAGSTFRCSDTHIEWEWSGSAWFISYASSSIKELDILLSGEDQTNDVLKVEQQYNYENIAAGTVETTIKGTPGFLHSIIINTKGSSSNVLTVYDNSVGSGTKIATIDTTSNVGAIVFNCKFNIGLTVVSATGTGADFTAVYR